MAENKVSFGYVDSFDSDNKTIVAYLERFDLFVQANEVSNEKKVPIFLSILGGKTYALLCNLLTKAVEIAQNMKSCRRDTQLFKSSDTAINQLTHTNKRESNPSSKREKPTKPCYCCGKINYTASQCKFKEATCHKCQKKGHIVSVCRSSGQTNPNRKRGLAPDRMTELSG